MHSSINEVQCRVYVHVCRQDFYWIHGALGHMIAESAGSQIDPKSQLSVSPQEMGGGREARLILIKSGCPQNYISAVMYTYMMSHTPLSGTITIILKHVRRSMGSGSWKMHRV